MPEMAAPMPIERPVVATHGTEAVTVASHYLREVSGGEGIGIGRGGGMGSGYGQGVGSGFGGFIGGLRKSGLDVVLVIDGTGSMKLIIDQVKDKMKQLVLALHRMVPVHVGADRQHFSRTAAPDHPNDARKVMSFLRRLPGSVGQRG